MTAFSSGLNFLSGIVLHFGTVPSWTNLQSRPVKRKRRQFADDPNHTPLTPRQKKELLDSIRHDDWFE